MPKKHISCHFLLTCNFIIAGFVEFSHVEFQANDGKHEDGHKQQQANLQQGDHSLHNGLQHHLQAWKTTQNNYRRSSDDKTLNGGAWNKSKPF